MPRTSFLIYNIHTKNFVRYSTQYCLQQNIHQECRNNCYRYSCAFSFSSFYFFRSSGRHLVVHICLFVVCVHSYIHTCIHTYVHTYMYTYIQTYVLTYISLYICMCVCMSFIFTISEATLHSYILNFYRLCDLFRINSIQYKKAAYKIRLKVFI